MADETPRSSPHPVSASCRGEKCRVCGAPATHKVEEALMWDVDFTMLPPLPTPVPIRHPFTAYVCCAEFRRLMGPAVYCEVPGQEPA